MSVSLDSSGMTIGSSTLSVSGTAPSYIIRAWCRKNSGYDGQGNGIMDSFNVSSLTQLSTGRWRFNYSTAMIRTWHCAIATANRNNDDSHITGDISDRTSSYSTFCTKNFNNGNFDFGIDMAAIDI